MCILAQFEANTYRYSIDDNHSVAKTNKDNSEQKDLIGSI